MSSKILLIFFLMSCLMTCPHSSVAEPVPSLPLPAKMVLSKYSVLMDEGRYKEAVDLLLSFQSMGEPKLNKKAEDPKGYHDPEIYFALGNGYLIQEQFEPAVKAFQQALEKNPDHTLSWLNMAKALYEQDKYAEAAICFLRGYESSNDKLPERLYHSAASYLMAEEYEQSIEIFDRLIRDHASETRPEWKENFVYALLSIDEQKRALPIIREIIEAYEGEKKIRWQEILLYQYLQLDMHEQALAYAGKLINEYPENPKWWKALAHIHSSEGQYIDALVAMTIYGLLTPINQEEMKLVADLNMQLGIPVKAIALYEAALDEKQNEHILRNLIMAYQEREQYEKAINRIEGMDHDKISPDLIMLKGELQYTMGRYEDAGDTFRQVATAEDKLAGRAWLMAGYSAWQLDDIINAKEDFEKASQYQEQMKPALKAIKMIEKR